MLTDEVKKKIKKTISNYVDATGVGYRKGTTWKQDLGFLTNDLCTLYTEMVEGVKKNAASIVEEMMEDEEHWKPIADRIMSVGVEKKGN